ncbi:RlpA-like double-psi beta-barrel-protein domain-containing protein-containing protein, partial [Cunninghamella echinulata]
GDFEGQATYFKPKTEGGPIGACGKKEDDNSQIVALNLHQYGSPNAVSGWCNRKVYIRHGDKHTTATINDACPGCSRNSLDLTPSVFEKLAAFKTGVVPIQW